MRTCFKRIALPSLLKAYQQRFAAQGFPAGQFADEPSLKHGLSKIIYCLAAPEVREIFEQLQAQENQFDSLYAGNYWRRQDPAHEAGLHQPVQ